MSVRRSLGSSPLSTRLPIRLVPCPGAVLGLRAVIDKHVGVLSREERLLLLGVFNHLQIPTLSRAVLEGPWRAVEDTGATLARRSAPGQPSGARSAVWLEEGLKLKGCRPDNAHRVFPFEWLPDRAVEIARTQVPFGVLTVEGVLRELLGYAFCTVHRVPCAAVPVCCYEYGGNDGSLGFCLVQRVLPGRRAEMFLDLRGLRLSDLSRLPGRSRQLPIGSEALLLGLNSRWYADQKARLLAKMHFRGGFRGLLNSNIGNDVIAINGPSGAKMMLCDFDSFGVKTLPTVPTTSFLEDFALRSLLEVVKGSVPILDVIDRPRGADARGESRAVADAYRRRSSLWDAYRHHARSRTLERRWNWAAVEAALDRAFDMPAFLDASCTVLLSPRAIQHTRRKDRWDYVPHEEHDE